MFKSARPLSSPPFPGVRHSVELALVPLFAVGLLAAPGCSDSGEEPVVVLEEDDGSADGPADATGDSGLEAPPDVEGTDCPCPEGAYCDLSSNTCKVGCIENENCPDDAYCDEEARECIRGCRDGSCGANAACRGEPKSCQCDQGYHRCGDSCVSDDSVDHCGDRCSPCPAPGEATATCENGSCGYDCDPGTYPCGGDCVSLDNFCSNCPDRAGTIGCSTDTDCCDGYVCSGGSCQKEPGASCSSGSECGGNATCEGGECCKQTTASCQSNLDCCDGLVCHEGACRKTKGSRCSSRDECATEDCESGTCCDLRGHECSEDSHCCERTTCSGGECKTKPGGTCFDSGECAGEARCYDETCCVAGGDACEKDSDCCGDGECDNGTCVVGLNQPCDSDEGFEEICSVSLVCCAGERECRKRQGSYCSKDSECCSDICSDNADRC